MQRPTPDEIRKRLAGFAAQWRAASREGADAKLFWARFYECYGIQPEAATIYEKAVTKLDGAQGFIDSFIPGKLIVEHKSRGKNLESAFAQAADYFLALPSAERPRYIITSDFARFRLYDLRQGLHSECALQDLPKRAAWFRFLLEEDAAEIAEETPANREAAYRVSDLHESLLQANFKGHDLEVFLTRLVFCLFADRTGIFGEDQQFSRLVANSEEDGSDLGPKLAALFDVLNTPPAERQRNLDPSLASFNYVNGKLFEERTRTPAFEQEMRALMLACAQLDWGGISPAIFGAMFQGVLEKHTPNERRPASRRELGAHYTSERNILRAINPLFMDSLREEFNGAQRSKPRLRALYDRLPTLRFLDPACGCGNFLVIAYRELRRLENDVIAALHDFDSRQGGLLDVSTLCRVRVSQLFGIEIDEAAAHIARVALWITDHQMNLEAAQRFGTARASVPIEDTPHIHCDNALRIDWSNALPGAQCSFIMGNPPFLGKNLQKAPQKADMKLIFGNRSNAGVLDYVAAWYLKALEYIRTNPAIEVAFVSTNSITQGEQVSALWPLLLQAGVKIRFAHRTFVWKNEGKGNAAVHCVIIGFGLREPSSCVLFDYQNGSGEGAAVPVKRINPYLVDAEDTILQRRTLPICPVPQIMFGSMANDNGHLLLSPDERDDLIANEPDAERYIRRFVGATEFINSKDRYCLWLVGIAPAQLRSMSLVYDRVNLVRKARLESDRETTQELAATPYLFGEIRQPTTGSLLIVPRHSSEEREYLPIGFAQAEDLVVGDANLMIPAADLFHFGVLCSSMHNAWMRAVCGRIKSDYRYSAGIVYNNFPWPEAAEQQREGIVKQAQAILDARNASPESSLADLYDPLAMPDALIKAHHANDRAVDAAFSYRGKTTDAARVAYLLTMYQRLTSLFANERPKQRRRQQTKARGKTG